jgi:hypothetical protein
MKQAGFSHFSDRKPQMLLKFGSWRRSQKIVSDSTIHRQFVSNENPSLPKNPICFISSPEFEHREANGNRPPG